MVVWECCEGQSDRQTHKHTQTHTAVANIHFASATPHRLTRNVMDQTFLNPHLSIGWVDRCCRCCRRCWWGCSWWVLLTSPVSAAAAAAFDRSPLSSFTAHAPRSFPLAGARDAFEKRSPGAVGVFNVDLGKTPRVRFNLSVYRGDKKITYGQRGYSVIGSGSGFTVNLGSDSLGKSDLRLRFMLNAWLHVRVTNFRIIIIIINDLGVSSVSRIHFGFRFMDSLWILQIRIR